MCVKKNIYLMLFTIWASLSAAIVDLSDLNELTSTTTLKLTGAIQNIQVAPFNDKLISFELKGDDESVSLYLYNRAKKRIVRVESQVINTTKKKVSKTIDEHLFWHPSDPSFVFYGNAGNKDNIYICRLADEDLNNKYAIKGYLMKFKETEGDENDENGKPIKAKYKDPAFSSNGENIFFIRKLAKKGENFVLCKTPNSETAEEGKFEELTYEIIAQKKFDLENPQPSPKVGSNVVAYIENKNRKKKNDPDFYQRYSINIVDADNKEEAEVNTCEGFYKYSYFWNKTGDYLYYYRAVPREKTPEQLLNDKENVLNLYGSKINQIGEKIFSIPLSNQQTDIILEDVRDRGFASADENNLLVPVLRDFNSIVAVNLDKWRKKEDSFSEIIPLTYPSYYPFVSKNDFFFVNYKDGPADTYIDMISASKIKLNFPAGATAAPTTIFARTTRAETPKTVVEKPIVTPPVAKPVEVKKETPPVVTKPEVDLKDKIITLLKQNEQLSMIDFIRLLGLKTDDKAKMTELQQILLAVSDIKTLNNNRYFVIKSSGSTETKVDNEINKELITKNSELETLKNKNNLTSADLTIANKEKNSELALITDFNSDVAKKKLEISNLESRIKSIRDAGSNQLISLQAELKSIKENLQFLTADLTKEYDEIIAQKKDLNTFENNAKSLRNQMSQLGAQVATLNKDKKNAQAKAETESKKALEEATKAAEAQVKADAQKNAFTDEKDEYQDEDEDSEYANEDEDTAVETVQPVVPAKTEPTTVKKRR